MNIITNEKEIIDDFHKLYYNTGKHELNNWLGVQVLKNPMDLMIIQEMIYELKPDVIVETGTYKGGSAYYMATLLDLIGKGKIITIDNQISYKGNYPKHKRITFLTSNSTEPNVLKQVKKQIKKNDVVLVLLDSAHTYKHVLKELEMYSPLVSKNSYLICEDTNIDGNPVTTYTRHDGGPMRAVKTFLKINNSFEIDKTKEKLLLTYFPNGFLKRIK